LQRKVREGLDTKFRSIAKRQDFCAKGGDVGSTSGASVAGASFPPVLRLMRLKLEFVLTMATAVFMTAS
jgi:hypothetical protein